VPLCARLRPPRRRRYTPGNRKGGRPGGLDGQRILPDEVPSPDADRFVFTVTSGVGRSDKPQHVPDAVRGNSGPLSLGSRRIGDSSIWTPRGLGSADVTVRQRNIGRGDCRRAAASGARAVACSSLGSAYAAAEFRLLEGRGVVTGRVCGAVRTRKTFLKTSGGRGRRSAARPASRGTSAGRRRWERPTEGMNVVLFITDQERAIQHFPRSWMAKHLRV
jgi:hypothetical protein